MMFWKGTGNMARLGQQRRREQGKRGKWWWRVRAGVGEWTVGSIERGELAHSPQALVWPFGWVCRLPTGLGALGLVKVPKPLSIARQKRATD